jgi:DNA mismatch repair protein MutS
MPPRKKTSTLGTPSIEKLYEESYTTYTEKYGPRTAVFLQVGSFYEMYDKFHSETGASLRNLREVAEALGGSPSIKQTESEWLNVMWGFPVSAMEKNEQILIQREYTIVIISQDRDATARITGRTLDRVSSPGTYIDSTGMGIMATDERRVVTVLIDAYTTREGKPAWYVASTAFSVATGECTSVETNVPVTEGKPNLDALAAFWSANTPSELVVWTRGFPTQLLESEVRPWFVGTFHGPIHIYEAPPTSAAATRGYLEYLHRIYARDTALSVGKYLDVERYQCAMESLTLLLRWIEDHNPSYLVNLRNHTMWESGDELILGNAALQQLGMLPIVKPRECLFHWLNKAITPMGKRAIKERCVRPITDVEELNARQNRIAELRGNPELRNHFFNMADLAATYRKFNRGQGEREGLLGLLVTAKKALALDTAMASANVSNTMPVGAKTFVEGLLETWDTERIRGCNTDHVWGIGPYHPWKRGILADLDAAEDEWAALQKEIAYTKQSWNTLIDEDDAIKVEWSKDTLEYEWTTTKRRAIALTTVLKQRKNYILDNVTKGASNVLLSSDHLTGLSQKAKDIWQRWTTLAETHWLRSWTTWEGNYELIDWIAEVDVDAALAKCADEYGYVKPTYVSAPTEEAGIHVTGLRHPIIERVRSDTPYITHSIALGNLGSVGNVETAVATAAATATNGILLYGVNAAGKSSLSKAIGLAVLMAQIGMPVPATTMTIAPYNGLYTRILGNDNLWAGMSSFVVEMTELRTILNAGPRSLVLGDELCAGTETTSAIAIVGAGIRRLVEKGAHFVFATHLHELLETQEIAELATVVKPYHLSVKAPVKGEGHTLIYDRVLREGRGPAIYGLEVCRGLDMDRDFLEYAAAIRRRWDGTEVDFAKASRYNAAVPVQVCDACGAKDGLETHHIVPQAAANADGFVSVGKHKNDRGNLVVLCESCHDRHHAGELEIRGWIATSTGRKLDVGTPATPQLPTKPKLDLSRFKRVV